jgi:hypothetical protein
MTNQPFTKCAEVWPLCSEVSQAIYQLTRPIINPLAEELGPAQGRGLYALLTARSYEPESLSLERVCRRTPYASPETAWAFLPVKELAERDLLEAQNDGSYRLTTGGRAVIARILKEFYAGLAGIEQSIGPAYSSVDLERAATLLEKIVTASFNSPFGKWSLTTAHRLAPAGEVAALAHIDQALDDLTAFRDDAHLAAWQPLGVTGPAWELFTFLWRGEVKNAGEMAEKAAARGHTREAYQSALGDLIGRGWVRAAGNAEWSACEVTEAGREIREEAEAATDRNFYTPWQVLSETELNDLGELLTRLKTALAHAAEAVPA